MSVLDSLWDASVVAEDTTVPTVTIMWKSTKGFTTRRNHLAPVLTCSCSSGVRDGLSLFVVSDHSVMDGYGERTFAKCSQTRWSLRAERGKCGHVPTCPCEGFEPAEGIGRNNDIFGHPLTTSDSKQQCLTSVMKESVELRALDSCQSEASISINTRNTVTPLKGNQP